MPAHAAAALPRGRAEAARLIGAALASDWPQPDLLDILHLQAAASPAMEHFGIWLMIERASGTVVGDVGFTGTPAADGSAEIGYSVVPSRRRRGYATEAVRALLAWASAQREVAAVVAGCDRDNIPSIRLLERLGFERIGERDDQVRWQLDGLP